MGDTTEMVELNKGGDEAAAAGAGDTGTDETSLTENNNQQGGDDLLDTSVLDGSNPDTGATTSNTLSDLRQNVVSMRHREAGFKRSYALDKKDFLDKELGIKLNKGDGPNSSILFDEMEITMDKNRKKLMVSSIRVLRSSF